MAQSADSNPPPDQGEAPAHNTTPPNIAIQNGRSTQTEPTSNALLQATSAPSGHTTINQASAQNVSLVATAALASNHGSTLGDVDDLWMAMTATFDGFFQDVPEEKQPLSLPAAGLDAPAPASTNPSGISPSEGEGEDDVVTTDDTKRSFSTPFAHGFRRDVVFDQTGSMTISYIAPDQITWLESCTVMEQYLTKTPIPDLTILNFCWDKIILGVTNPERETICIQDPRQRYSRTRSGSPIASLLKSAPEDRPPPPRQNPPNQCGGCGAQGKKMHPRDLCPARGLTCYTCGKTGQYKSVCRSPQKAPHGKKADITDIYVITGTPPTDLTDTNAADTDTPHRDQSPTPEPLIPRPHRLENTLKPSINLSPDMTLTEAENWLKGFAAWFNWNASILDSKSPVTKRVLLENFLDEKMLLKLRTDVTVTMDTPITGDDGLISKLRSYYYDDHPIFYHRHDFTVCKQDPGEPFLTWWEKKMKKAQECMLKTMTIDNWLEVELIRGINDPTLQKRLLQESDPILKDMVRIAMQWQSAEDIMTHFIIDNEPSEN